MAGGGKETPRQKMIGMMYLVLTALLAMNISKNVLDAFIIVNEGLERTNSNLNSSTTKMMKAFQESTKSTPQAGPYYAKAVEAEKMISETSDYIDKLKHALIVHVEAKPGADTLRLKYVEQKDNYDKPTELMIGSDDAHPKTGEFSAVELKGKLVGVHDRLLKMLADMQKKKETQLLTDDYENLKKKIETLKPEEGGMENGVPATWEIINFDHMVLAGIITNLTKMQADLNNVEAEIVGNLSGAAGKVMVKFDKLAAKVVAPSSYILAGQPYKADIFIAAGSSDFKEENMQVVVNPTSYDSVKGTIVGGTPVKLVDGMGKYEVGTGGQGEQKYKAVIKFKQPTGEYKFYTYETSYMVAAPSVAVSPEKMNVFYIGVENPIAVTAAGISPSELQVSGSGGGISISPKGPGKYIVKVSQAGVTKISVAARTKDGVKPQGPPLEFRVKKIPDPVPSVAGKKSGMEIKKSEAQGIGGVLALLEGFDFQANFVVVSYEFGATIKGTYVTANGTGPSLTSEMKGFLQKVSTGSKIFFDGVKARGPDGTIRNIGTLSLKVKG